LPGLAIADRHLAPTVPEPEKPRARPARAARA
jgi:hypothetical protein